MKVVSNDFKINIDNKDILVTEEQRMEFLRLHNKLNETLLYIDECKDVTLSQVSMLEELQHHLHTSLNFVPQKEENGKGAKWYADFVLESDELAYKPTERN